MQFPNAFSIEFDEVVHLVGGGSNSLSRSFTELSQAPGLSTTNVGKIEAEKS